MQTETLNPNQLKILELLIRTDDPKKYSELRPIGMENDLYNYHLQFLLKKEYLQKDNDLYSLSEKGKMLISNMGITAEQKKLFKVSVAVFLFREHGGEKQMLLQERKRAPFYGDITTIAGKVKPGELITNTAARKLKQETGLLAKFKHITTQRKIRKNNSNELLEDTFYNICCSTAHSGELEEENEWGKHFWAAKDKALELVKKSVDIGKEDLDLIATMFDNELSEIEFKHIEQVRQVKSY